MNFKSRFKQSISIGIQFKVCGGEKEVLTLFSCPRQTENTTASALVYAGISECFWKMHVWQRVLIGAWMPNVRWLFVCWLLIEDDAAQFRWMRNMQACCGGLTRVPDSDFASLFALEAAHQWTLFAFFVCASSKRRMNTDDKPGV